MRENFANDRIALVVGALSGGGAERVMVQLANQLAGTGRPVDLITFHNDDCWSGEISDNVRVVNLGRHGALRSTFALANYLMVSRVKVVITTLYQNTSAVLLAAGILCLRRIGKPRIIVREANTLAHARLSGLQRLAYRAVRQAYRFVDKVVAVSAGLREELVRYSGIAPDRVVTIRNPVPELQLETIEKRHEQGDVSEIVAVGSLTTRKDFRTLIEAIAIVLRERRVVLRIYGEGPERNDLEARIKKLGVGENVELCGFDSNWMIRRYDVFVLSSIHEGMPNVLVQAACFGIPVVATDCPHGPREVLEVYRCGELVPVGDAKVMAAAIMRVLSTTFDTTEGISRMREAFSQERHLAGYLELISEHGL